MSFMGNFWSDITSQVSDAAAWGVPEDEALSIPRTPYEAMANAAFYHDTTISQWSSSIVTNGGYEPDDSSWKGALLSEWMRAAEANPSSDITLGSYTSSQQDIDEAIKSKVPKLGQTSNLHYPMTTASVSLQSMAQTIINDAWADLLAAGATKGESLTHAMATWELGGHTIAQITDARSYFAGGRSAAGGPGGPGTTPLPFVAGGPWAETAFRGKSFTLEPVLRAGFGPATRPGTGGVIVDHPHRYATIHVIDIDGTVRFSTTDFALQRVSKQVGEKFQAISTWDGPQLVFRCEKGAIYQLGFAMLNTKSFDWLRSFQYNWTRYFRGSSLASSQSRLYVLYGGTLLGGYPISMNISETTTAEPLAQLAIQMYITDDVALPDMTVLNASTGEYTWQGDTFVEGTGVANLDGYVRQAPPTPESINDTSTFGADIVTSGGEVLA